MKKLYAGLLVVLALVACTPTGSGVESSPTPIVVPEGTPSPAVSSTPSQEELSAEAERVYRTFFNEWIRLEREGGADEPTQILVENGAEGYLEGVSLMLKEQRQRGETAGGPLPIVTVKPDPGMSAEGSDPRLTLAVCEDHSAGWYRDEDGQRLGLLLQGRVFLKEIDAQFRVVWARTKEVQKCEL